MSIDVRGEPRVGLFVSALALVCALGLFASVMWGAALRGHGYDLAPLPTAGRLVALGQVDHLYAQSTTHYNVVDDDTFRRAVRDVGFALEPTPFVYPPLVAVLVQPAARVPFPVLFRAWTALSIVFTLAGVALMLTAYFPRANTPLVWAGLLVVLCGFEPLRYGFWLGQTTAIIFPVVMGAVVLQRRDHPVAAGVLLALAGFVKITPLVLAAVWLWRGPRRAAVAAAVTLALLWGGSVALLGVAINAAYVSRVGAIGEHVVIALNNHSALAFLSRFWFPPGAWLDWRMYPVPAGAAWLVLGLMAAGAAAIVVALREAGRGDERALRQAESMAWIAMLLLPGIAWTHYFVFILPVMAVLVSGRGIAAWIAAGVAYLACCRGWLPPQEASAAVTGTVGLLRATGPTLAAALLGVAILAAARKLGQAPGSGPGVRH